MSAAADESRAERRRSEAVVWLRALLRESALPLPPPRASDDELRAALADGALLCAALDKLARPAPTGDQGGAAPAATECDDVGRFLAAAERMGLPSFTASDLDTGPVSAVVACVLALRDQFLPHAGEGWNCSVPQNGRKHGMELPRRENGQVTQNFEVTEDSKQMETMVQKVSKSPAVSEPLSPKVRPGQSSISRHAGHNFHEVFQLRQGGYFDLPSCNISEMMKSTSMDNAPTQSLLSVVNGILDEIIERKIGEIPYQLSCLLRRIVLEIERRISTQAEHIRNVSTSSHLFLILFLW
ncbi:hypothetical protein ACQ4PT_015595 [Festuca glaucescens]